MDLNMPVMGGFESLAKIKKYCKGRLPYTVALSASLLDFSSRSKCQLAGFDDQFCVPLTANDIKFKILDRINIHRQSVQADHSSNKIFSINEVD